MMKPYVLTEKRKKHLELMSQKNIGGHLSIEHKDKIRKFRIGKKPSPETIAKMIKTNTGRKNTEETKKLMSKSAKGKVFSIEHRINIGKAHSGEKCSFWKGGISDHPKYAVDWTSTLRRSIRERDKYICQICKSPQGDKSLAVHHIDYDKFNCDPKNLVSLCDFCHARTNFDRKYWINYFKNI